MINVRNNFSLFADYCVFLITVYLTRSFLLDAADCASKKKILSGNNSTDKKE